jgi:hypothetical protein
LSDTTSDLIPGEKKGEKVFDSLPILALSRFVGIADGLNACYFALQNCFPDYIDI